MTAAIQHLANADSNQNKEKKIDPYEEALSANTEDARLARVLYREIASLRPSEGGTDADVVATRTRVAEIIVNRSIQGKAIGSGTAPAKPIVGKERDAIIVTRFQLL
jgi:hypothetical protein